MEFRALSLSVISLTKNGKLDCSSSSHYFSFLLGFLLQLVESCLYMLTLDQFHSKLFFESVFQNMLMSNNDSPDNVNYGEVFYGGFANEFQTIYINMLELWKDIQSDMMPHESARVELENKEYKERLITIYSALNTLRLRNKLTTHHA
jgi:hypothetical protein